MTHGHELKGGWLEGRGIFRGRAQRGKNWDNCNSIINEIYFLKTLGKLTIYKAIMQTLHIQLHNSNLGIHILLLFFKKLFKYTKILPFQPEVKTTSLIKLLPEFNYSENTSGHLFLFARLKGRHQGRSQYSLCLSPFHSQVKTGINQFPPDTDLSRPICEGS